jgi:hypothetical protein
MDADDQAARDSGAVTDECATCEYRQMSRSDHELTSEMFSFSNRQRRPLQSRNLTAGLGAWRSPPLSLRSFIHP